jgi:hypothetical protein
MMEDQQGCISKDLCTSDVLTETFSYNYSTAPVQFIRNQMSDGDSLCRCIEAETVISLTG